MNPDLRNLILLQSLDQRATELEREVASLPRHIAEIEKALDQHLRRLEADKAALTANQKERKKGDSDIQVQEQKISKLKDQMLQAKTNDQYRAFQHEIEYCQKEIRRVEDRILELMSESEALDGNVKAADVALKAEKQQVEGEKASARQRTAADQAELDELRRQRQEMVRDTPRDLVGSYERIRKRAGSAVAEVIDGACTACRMALRPQFFQDLKAGRKVMYCESCNRILFYNPPVEVDENGPSAGSADSLPAET